MNDTLLGEFTAYEIKYALFQEVLGCSGSDVVVAVLDFLQSGCLQPKLNFMHVALIPKVKDHKDMTQLRPISLYNVIYKISAKVLANHLMLIMKAVIDYHQSAFVPQGKVLHHMHNHTQGKVDFQALKLDISKAYDRVEWGFLETVMRCMEFAPRCIQLIMEYVTTIKYSFLLNGNFVGSVSPQRGLHQGDSLSSYPFLLCAEVFSRLIMRVERQRLLHGVSICSGALLVSHLFIYVSYL